MNDLFHPAANLFPMMDAEAFAALKQDISQRGQRDPIVFLDGKVLDGRNRLKACQELGIEPDECEIEECDSPIAYVLSANLHRRHLTSSQRAAIAAEALPMLEAEAKERQRLSKGQGIKVDKELPTLKNGDGKAVEQAAKLVGTNRQYVQDAKKIKAETPDLFEAVKAGKVTIPAAKREVAAKAPCPNCGGIERDDDGDCSSCYEPAQGGSRPRPLATKENTKFREHWLCLNCGSNELHLYGYCKPCWGSASKSQQREIADPDSADDTDGDYQTVLKSLMKQLLVARRLILDSANNDVQVVAHRKQQAHRLSKARGLVNRVMEEMAEVDQ